MALASIGSITADNGRVLLDLTALFGASHLDVCAAGVGGGVVDTANSLTTSAPDTARKLYESVLSSDSAEGPEKACAAAGIAALDTAPEKATTGISLVTSAWDTFFATWVDPLWKLTVPCLSVLAILLLAARLLPRWAVSPNTIGIRHWHWLNRSAWVARHWLAGVGSLILAALLLTIGLSWDALRNDNTAREWLLRGSTALLLALLGIVFDMRIGSKELHPGTNSHLITRTVTLVLTAAVPLLVLLLPVSIPIGSLGWLIAPLALAIGGLGAWIVARGNGLQIGMLIEGHGADGTAGAAAAQRVQARLYEIARTQPGHAGLLIPQATDATIPDDALGLVPDGAAAKAAGAVLRALWPKSAWRITVDDVGNGSVHVTVYRNGRYADAATIRRTDFGLLDGSAGDGSVGSTATSAKSDEPTAAPLDVWTGVAAFVLVTLAQRYPFLDNALYRVREWKSIAAYTAALSATVTVERIRLLREAIAFDGNNIAAEIAKLNEMNGKDAATSAQLSKDLDKVLDIFEKRVVAQRIDSKQLKANQMWLRLHFNLAVSYCNTALALNPTSAAIVTPAELATHVGDAKKAASLWASAIAHLQNVLDQVVQMSGENEGHSAFEATMRGPALALWYLTSVVDVGSPAQSDIPKPKLKALKRQPDTLALYEANFRKLSESTLQTRLFRYQRACVYAYLGKYDQATPDLVAVVGNPELRKWAQADPSFRAWRLDPKAGEAAANQLCDPPTETILDVAPFSVYRAQLRSRGLVSSADLRRHSTAIARELGLGDLEGRQWLRIATLQRALVDGGLDKEDNAMLLSLLLLENICSVEGLRTEILKPGLPQEDQIAAIIAKRAGLFNWVSPSQQSFEDWVKKCDTPVVVGPAIPVRSDVTPPAEVAASASPDQPAAISEAHGALPNTSLKQRARSWQQEARALWKRTRRKIRIPNSPDTPPQVGGPEPHQL